MYIPKVTYRLQFNFEFGFNAARKIVPYLKDLGISDIYASPILKAAKGSMHGYDQVDPSQLNPELGNAEEYEDLLAESKNLELKWLQDIVPNHMAYSAENQMIVDLFENGANSRFYNFFDIEWNHPHASASLRVLAPFLGNFYHEALENEELKLKYDPEGFSVNYFENRFPLSMESYVDILSFRQSNLRNKLGKNDPSMIKYLAVLYILRSLPSSDELDERYSQIKFVKSMLWELYNENEDIKVFINENLKIYNGRKGNPESFDLLDKLLNEQYFRLAYWKVANEEINYRRFFNISSLISLKMENDDVFNRVHSFIFKLIKDGNIDGLRIDHVDGLYDPTNYLKKLRSRAENCYIIVEKILDLEEELPEIWPIEGTTGYEFTNYVNGIFVRSDNERKITNIYQDFTHFLTPAERVCWDKKRLIIQTRMAGEVERLAFIIEALSSKDRRGIDITMHGLKRALEEILTFFPVYRTYVNSEFFSENDRRYFDIVLKKVREENPRLSNEYNYICDLLTMNYGDRFTEEQKKKVLDFIMKFQQLTGPLMAKGFEDTALYIYNRFISLNEVGGSPDKFGIPLEQFHQFNETRFESWPNTLNTTSTHDTKRGEDVRARMNVISEIPDEWEKRVKFWSELNISHKTEVKGLNSPDRNDEYFLYQTLVGSYPEVEEDMQAYPERIKEYMLKAVREAKIHSAWIRPDEAYEAALMSFVEKILERTDSNEFLKEFYNFQKKINFYGYFNSLSQNIIKLSSPGVPDIYQGCELWNYSLVDPDNRRPVNYNLRKQYLHEIKEFEDVNIQKYLKKLVSDMSDGKIKMFLTYKVIKARNENPELFQLGEYIPLETGGKYKNNIVAFARHYQNLWAITIAPRFLTSLVKENHMPFGQKVWDDTHLILPTVIKQLKDILSNDFVGTNSSSSLLSIGDILKNFPVSLIIGNE
ncbi:MAG: malto-oligosyltrehalose synthase [Bacteroidota bacterium]|nr:malto-oligosyltrehalose synthase [Bacteroidota bacterium]MDP4195176.1 malto-oligosyltrehalose synthase [Bacteroidota bacterium]